MNSIQFLVNKIKPILMAHGYKEWSLKKIDEKGNFGLFLRCEGPSGFLIQIFKEQMFEKTTFEEIAGMGWVNCGKIELMIFEKGVEK